MVLKKFLHLIPVDENINSDLKEFYGNLLTILQQEIFKKGKWQLLNCNSAWEGNQSFESFIISSWQFDSSNSILICVNYADNRSQSYVKLPFEELKNQRWQLKDLMNDIRYERDGNEMKENGLYLDMSPWQCV
jgi:hypothetical protein